MENKENVDITVAASQQGMADHATFTPIPTDESEEITAKSKNGLQARQENGSRLTASSSEESMIKRETWSKGIEFILSCVGFAVGLGNVWRFPYLCFKNGGGVFLIPYIIFLVIGGVPLFFLEISLGQFMGIAGVKVWNIAPILKGIGYATTVIVFLMNCYYIIILAWNGVYLVESFSHINRMLPWVTCGNWWNTDECQTEWFSEECRNVSFPINITSSVNASSTLAANVSTIANSSIELVCKLVSHKGSDSATEYWRYRILQRSPGVDHVDGLVWELAVSLLVVWILCYFCIWKGVKWTGKVVYFTALFPYVVITILLIRGVTLDGAAQGLEFYLKPDFSQLGKISVWVDAGTQIFFSYAVALGALTALGSYNKFNNNCHKQVIIIALVNSATSIYAGIAIFSVLGFMAKQQGVPVANVTDSGPGLAFIAYPTACATMPFVPHLWAVLFFLMIVFVGLDSQFVGVESFVTTIVDIFPSQLRRRHRRELFAAMYCVVSFLVGLTMVTRGGIYVFELFNYYSASGLSLLWVSFFECVAVAWIYGGGRFYDNLETMLGYRINIWFRICWTALSPAASALLFIFMWVKFEPLKLDKYVYPDWAQGIGLCMAFASMLCIPGYAIYAMAKATGTLKQRWMFLITPVFSQRQKNLHTSEGMDVCDNYPLQKKVPGPA